MCSGYSHAHGHTDISSPAIEEIRVYASASNCRQRQYLRLCSLWLSGIALSPCSSLPTPALRQSRPYKGLLIGLPGLASILVLSNSL